jgi:hypothetical protein
LSSITVCTLAVPTLPLDRQSRAKSRHQPDPFGGSIISTTIRSVVCGKLHVLAQQLPREDVGRHGREVAYRDVEVDGAAKAARRIAELL